MIDYKKDYKHLYLPKTAPEIVDLPLLPFFTLSGRGDPNGEEFASKTAALYSLSYAVKMSYKAETVPEGYYEYKVFPLEGLWDLIDHSKSKFEKSSLRYTIMIRQPDFVTKELFRRFVEQTVQKKPNPFLKEIQFVQMAEGLCCQLMHLGSYDDESESFAKMEQFCVEQGYTRSSKAHREIYLSNPQKTEQSKLKTVLRYQVKALETVNWGGANDGEELH